ncbi:MAG: DUF4364 family protein [Oscillospiraceae bacterium]|jgi:translation initiation factor RLI1|nr:DUF4364 family protein [Oscillospiraceae bacterium]
MEELKAGIGPSGLTDFSEVKVAICYMLSCCDEPLRKEEIFDILDRHRVVNYFYFAQALDELTKDGQLQNVAGRYVLGADGCESANTLKETLARNIREGLADSAKSYSKRINFNRCHNVKVQEEAGGHIITCAIADECMQLMSVSLFVPETALLDAVRKRFEENSEEIYKVIVNLLTGEDFG